MITIVAKKDLVPDSYLRQHDTDEVRNVMKEIELQRKLNALSNGGFSRDKNIMATGAIPAAIYWDQRLRYVFHSDDPAESDELRKRFLRENPKFKTTDKRI